MFDELDVSFGNPDEFWKKSERERFKYFKNCSLHYFALLSDLETDDRWKRKARHYVLSCFYNDNKRRTDKRHCKHLD